MREPRACPKCLRRARLLAMLAPYVEKIATGAPGSRSPELLRLSDVDLAAIAAPKDAARLLDELAAVPERVLEAELEVAECWGCCPHDPLYPAGLREIADAPQALIGRGDPSLLEGLEPSGAVAVVGSRRATPYGREVAHALGRELAAAGLVVVSGLAFGIDACAHRGALEAGITFAVLGCGPDIPYPASHRSLWRRIEERGLVISELPPGTGVWRWAFPARNRIMAGLAGMTVVVEAAERSGSLITADLAADLGRDLGAVPGPVGSRCSVGANGLLAGGACVIRDAQDVIDAMLGPGAPPLEHTGPALEGRELAVLATMEGGTASCEEVTAKLEISGAEASASLAELEVLGYLTCSPLGAYARTPLKPPDGD